MTPVQGFRLLASVHAARTAALEELETEARLAGASLGDHSDHLAVTGRGLFESTVERAQVGGASDKVGETAGSARHRSGCATRPSQSDDGPAPAR